VLLGIAAPAAAAFPVSAPLAQWLCVAWLAGVAFLMHCLSRRARIETEVLSVDERGILDRRLMPRRIEWREIEAICPVDVDRNHVVDIRLRWPKLTLAETRWSVRIGSHCQIGYGVPAVSISMLLLDGNVADLLDVVGQHRPDLLHCTNRRVQRTAYR
jgi:hypothetical protein